MASRESKVVNKRRWDLLPWESVEEMVKVLEHGAKKYNDNNWRAEPYWRPSTPFASMMRHIIARFVFGELLDPESGLLHTAHIEANAAMSSYYDLYDLWDTEVEDSLMQAGEKRLNGGIIEKYEKVEDFLDAYNAEAEKAQVKEKTPLELAQEALERRKRELGLADNAVEKPSTLSVSEMARLDEEEEDE